MSQFKWLALMAWRDSRRNRARLLLFMSSIVLGIAALVAINSFGENLRNDIEAQAKTLLGADLSIEDNQPLPDSIRDALRPYSAAWAENTSFASMALFPRTGSTRLVEVSALKGAFPFYGRLETEPVEAAEAFKKGEATALVDRVLMAQFKLAIGDSVKVGEASFRIIGQLNGVPGRSSIGSMGAPLVYIPAAFLDSTQLIQIGSRVDYTYYIKTKNTVQPDSLVAQMDASFELAGLRPQTVASRQQNLQENFDSMNRFLSLVGFIALLLGCIGVASAIHIYVKGKIPTVAVLRCLGLKGPQAFTIYLLQIVAMGLVGAALGAALGALLQKLIPYVLRDFLPLQNVSTAISWGAVAWGILTGILVSVLFALLPLLGIRSVSPLRTLRSSVEEKTSESDYYKILIYILIFLFIFMFAYLQTGDWLAAIAFVGGVGGGLLLLMSAARLMIWLTRRFFPQQWGYVARQGIANLFRPNNQTLVLVTTIGLGTAMISTLFFIQSLLLGQIELTGAGKQPNLIAFGILPDQKEAVRELALNMNLPVMQEVSIVTIRLEAINGVTKSQNLHSDEKGARYEKWLYEREFRVTYRDTLDSSEEVIEGSFHNAMQDKQPGTIYVSIAETVAKAMKAQIGDRMTFDVQGRLIETVVGSVRKVDFRKMQTNFFVVFPTGVLEKAPQLNVLVSRTNSADESARFQQALVKQFPNVSVIDLTQILKTVESILGKLTFVIRFMSMFSILTGILVLISSIMLSKYQRIRESVLLRTLGGSRRQILLINLVEYAALGLLAALTGIGLSLAATFLLATLLFKVAFAINWLSVIWLLFAAMLLTVAIGLLNSREVLNKSPLEVLREEV
jgi:putative ABC transport system permease protein